MNDGIKLVYSSIYKEYEIYYEYLDTNKARLFLAMLDGVALHYLSIYDRYPLGSMRPQLIQAANDLCCKKIRE